MSLDMDCHCPECNLHARLIFSTFDAVRCDEDPEQPPNRITRLACGHEFVESWTRLEDGVDAFAYRIYRIETREWAS